MGELIKIVNEQESFLRGIEQETRNGNIKYELMTYPKGYLGVQQHVKDIVQVGNVIGREVNYERDNISKAYTRMRSFFKEKILGKRNFTIEELLNVQARNIMLLNLNLKHINEEARMERENLINYHEEICDEFAQNILTAPQRKKMLKEKTREFSKLREMLSVTKGYNEEYFSTERRFREARRNQTEEEHNYVMKMRDTIKLEQEKAFLDVMEQLLTKSVHISETYSRETEHIERHVERTKNVYIRLIKQQGQFFMLRDGVEKMSDYLLNLQRGVINGVREMNSIVNGADVLEAIYAPNMGNLKVVMEDIRNAYSQRAIEMESSLRDKLLER